MAFQRLATASRTHEQVLSDRLPVIETVVKYTCDAPASGPPTGLYVIAKFWPAIGGSGWSVTARSPIADRTHRPIRAGCRYV